jgi:CBS domain-containing protein
MNIGDALDQLGSLPYLAIPGEATMEEAAKQVTGMRQVRGIYVVDAKGQLLGTISLGVLIRHITSVRHRPQFHMRSLLSRITSEKMADLMERHVIFAGKEDDLRSVIDRMVTANIKEIPVVDENRCLIGVVGLLDLWNFLEKTS